MRPEEGTLISRAQAIGALLELLTDQPVIVCNGFPSREVQKIADRPTHFYMVGSMGNAPAIALGVALAKPHKQVVTFDGDGNVLMGMGTLSTVGALKPKNFIHVVFDNEVYGSTGNQPTISNVVPLEKVARAAGYVNTVRVLDRDDMVYEFRELLKKDGPSMLLVKVNEFQEEAERIALDPPELTKRFMKAIA
ncbi:MAG: thiamine pyrophosphate-dependent enzyme [Nitrospira sp.]|nr:thiamine pyrophosphate-dependent enzyme [Nitrospira sp.]MCP9464305.1 thiamine pyrophosphate-dependent enzyme [Nitrospira sp.]